MQKASGVDMTNYDGAIINLYEKDTFISSHNDVDESRSAINYPVIGINIGGPGNFSIESRDGDPKKLDLQDGTAYVFGVNGVNREVWHRTFPTPQKSFLPALTTKLDGKSYPAGSYRITITMRRVMPIKPDVPQTTKLNNQAEGPVKDERTIEEDMMMFQELVKANKGELPKSFMSGSRKWTINQYGNYDLVDATTGDIYQRNVNMETGLSEPEASQEETLDPAKKESALTKIQDMVKNQQLAEQLAIIGYDVKDLLNNLVKAKTMEEYNKVMEILDKLC
jgi:hypothetical protein